MLDEEEIEGIYQSEGYINSRVNTNLRGKTQTEGVGGGGYSSGIGGDARRIGEAGNEREGVDKYIPEGTR